MDANWFYESNGERQGPLTEVALSKLKETGVISDTNLVWTDGMADWISYGDSPLNLSNTGTPPPVPEKSSVEAQPLAQAEATQKTPFVARNARLREDSSVQIRSTLGRGWRLLRSDFWPLVGYCTLLAIIASFAMQIGLTVLFLLFPIMAGGYYYVLKRTRDQSGVIDDLFDGFRRRFGDLAIVNLAVMVPIMIGIFVPFVIAFIVFFTVAEQQGSNWGILFIVAIFLMILIGTIAMGWLGTYGLLAMMLVIDCDISAREALRLAWTASKKHWFKMALFGMITTALAYLGILALYIGAFVTSTWTMIASAYLYEDIFGDIPKKKISES